jgi:DNA repair exonuclease SbcCD ATPase subunit
LKWLKNIFKGKDAKGETIILRLLEIESWLMERQKDSGFEDNLQKIYSHMEEVAGVLAIDVKTLSSAQPNDATPPKLLRAGLAARGEIVKQMESLTEKLMPPRQRDIESAAAHHWTLVKGLERTVTTYGKAQRYVAALFPKIVESINSDMTLVSRQLVELEKEIDKQRKELEEIWYSKELVAGLSEELSGIDELERRIIEYKEKLTENQATSSAREAELKLLAASDEGKRTVELKKSLEEKREELSRAKDEMVDLIAPLTKALSRIRKQGSSDRLNLQHGDVFMQLSESPSRVQDLDISGSLEELRSHLASLGLKDRKKEKILDHIDLLISKKSLQKARSRRVALEDEIKGLEAHLTQSSVKALHLRDELNRGKKSLQSLQAVLDQCKENLAALKEKASGDESELKERLSKLSNRSIEIDLTRGK